MGLCPAAQCLEGKLRTSRGCCRGGRFMNGSIMEFNFMPVLPAGQARLTGQPPRSKGSSLAYSRSGKESREISSPYSLYFGAITGP